MSGLRILTARALDRVPGHGLHIVSMRLGKIAA
jgi:hypothetical protein